ncbi:hypothetical protein G7Y79_00054g088650 [Physcia stellaris]|nr:hypothetical protein G7Y79_00054g088650 [Physcia stellaris]
MWNRKEDDPETKFRKRIAQAKKLQSRRPYDTSTTGLFRNLSQPPPQNLSASTPNSNGTQQPQNTFSFGSQSQSFGGTQQPASNTSQGLGQSASFPPFSSIAASNTGFNFANGSSVPNNPFAAGINNAQPPASSIQSTGYQGSLFNIPPAAPPPPDPIEEAKARKKALRKAIDESTPAWAEGVNPFSKDAIGSDQQSQSAANGLDSQNTFQNQQSSSGSTPTFNPFGNTQSNPTTANIFGSVPQQSTTSQSVSNPFGNTQLNMPSSNTLSNAPSQQPFSNIPSLTPSQQPTFNILGNSQPQQPAPNFSASTQQQSSAYNPGSSHLFGISQPQQTETKQPPSSQNASNLFSVSQPQQQTSNWFENLKSQSLQTPSNQPESSQSASNIFSHLQPQQSQSPSNIFGNNPNPNQDQNSTSPTQNGGDSMSLTPDTSPAGKAEQATKASGGGFAFLNAPATAASQSSPGSLFDRVSQPSSQSAASASDPDANQKSQNQGTSLFDRISYPSESGDKSSKQDAQTVSSSSEPHKNVFTGFGRPASSALGSQDGQPRSTNIEASGSSFSGFGQPSASVPSTNGDPPATSNSKASSETFGGGASKSMFAGFGQPFTNTNQSAHDGQSSTPPSNEDLPKSKFPGFGLKRASNTEQISTKESSSTPKPSSTQFQGEATKSHVSNMFPGLPNPSAPTPSKDSQPATLLTAPTFKAPLDAPQEASSSSTIAKDSSLQPISLTPRTISQGKRQSGVPPAPPPDFTEEEKQQLTTLYRINSFDAGFKKFFRLDTIEDVQAVLNYYSTRRDAILNVPDPSKADTVGSKRKSSPSREAPTTKKTRFETADSSEPFIFQNYSDEHSNSLPTSNQVFSTQFNAPKQPSPGKRKAGALQHADSMRESGSTAKRTAHKDTVSYPSLSSPDTSDTSNIFKSIVSDAADRSTPLPSVGSQSVSTSVTPVKPPGANMFSLSKPSAAPISATPAKAPAANMLSSVKPPVTLDKATTSGNSTTSANTHVQQGHASTSKPAIKPPQFGSGAPVNFMSQFQQLSKKEAQSEKDKRKAEDLDSDEDDTEWERRYEEEQRAKKQSVEEAVKGKKFVLGKGLVSSEDGSEQALFLEPGEPSTNGASTGPHSRASSVSVLEQPQKFQTNGMTNIFGHLSDMGSGAEGNKTGDADDESTASESQHSDREDDHEGDENGEDENESEEDEEGEDDHEEDNHADGGSDASGDSDEVVEITNPFSSVNAKKTSDSAQQVRKEQSTSRSLFDRTETDKDGNLVKEIPAAKDKNPSGLFGIAPQGNHNGNPFKATPFSPFPSTTPSTKLNVKEPASAETSPGDHSWKAGTPIKFGSSTSKPDLEITSPTPTKPTLGGLFGSSQTSAPTTFTPSKPLFTPSQAGTPSTTKPTLSGLFGSSQTSAPTPFVPSKPVFTPIQATAPKAPAVGFGISMAKSSSSLAPPNAVSNNASRATSPGASSNAGSVSESGADGGDNEDEQHEQIDLASGGPGEEDEEVLFEVTGKAYEYKGSWLVKGQGRVRVLKHPGSGKTRILMRQEPSGKIVLNAALLSGIDYVHQPKAVGLGVATDSGQLVSYRLRVANDDDAAKLAEILEKNKTA